MEKEIFRKIIDTLGATPKVSTIKTRRGVMIESIYFRHRISFDQYLQLVDPIFWNGENREFDDVIYSTDDNELIRMFEDAEDHKIDFLFLYIDDKFVDLLVSLWDGETPMLDEDFVVKGEDGGFSLMSAIEESVDGVRLAFLGEGCPENELDEDMGVYIFYNPDEIQSVEINMN